MPSGLKDVKVAGLLCLVLGLASGCSQFDQRWQSAPSQPQTPIEGRWAGQWVSDVDGHHGPIRCAITHQGTNTYLASFSGTFWQIFPFQYDATLHGGTNDGQVNLSGGQNLGIPMGVFYYNGHAEDNRFYLTYRSQYDGGHFIMSRP